MTPAATAARDSAIAARDAAAASAASADPITLHIQRQRSLREQLGEVNRFNPSAITPAVFYSNSSTNTLSTLSYCYATDFIPVIPGETLFANFDLPDGVAWFSASLRTARSLQRAPRESQLSTPVLCTPAADGVPCRQQACTSASASGF